MQSLYLKLQYCYWIKDFEHTFNFEPSWNYKNNVHIIYAQNWLMKSSFANSLLRLSNEQLPEQKVDGIPEAKLKIDWEDFNPGASLKIHVVKSEVDNTVSDDKISNLLVDRTLKQEYENAVSNIEIAGNAVLEKLKNKIWTKWIDYVVWKMAQDLWLNSKKYVILKWIYDNYTTINGIDNDYQRLDYKIISDPKVKNFLLKQDVKTLLEEYKQSYDTYLSRTKFLNKIFDSSKVTALGKNFDESWFFGADHKILLQNHRDTGEAPLTITTSMAFVDVIEQEKSDILNQPEVKAKFEELTKQLSANESLVKFKEYLLENERILTLLWNCSSDYSIFIKNCWLWYLKENITDCSHFHWVYETADTEIRRIIETADAQNSLWKKIVDDFKNRFLPPFDLRIENEKDAVVGINKPVINFYYVNNGQSFKKEIWEIRTILSTGEKRIFYILNLLFEIYSLKQSWWDILLVMDDIADSFDYRNKYWIIEFLREISEESNIFMIILTHNFDFYRTIQSRLNCSRNNTNNCCRMTYKKEDNWIWIIKTDYLDPFKKFRENLHINPNIFIATIPFTRNLVQFSQGMQDGNGYYSKLTSVLHIKNDSMSITIQNIKDIFDATLNQHNTLNWDFVAWEITIEFIIKKWKILASSNWAGLNLENKIVLSIAIRLLAEQYMIEKIKLEEPTLNTDDIEWIQTFKLYEKFITYYWWDVSYKQILNTLKNVLLVTPEIIHLNNFMYEPLIDMSDNELIYLFNDIEILVKSIPTHLSTLL